MTAFEWPAARCLHIVQGTLYAHSPFLNYMRPDHRRTHPLVSAEVSGRFEYPRRAVVGVWRSYVLQHVQSRAWRYPTSGPRYESCAEALFNVVGDLPSVPYPVLRCGLGEGKANSPDQPESPLGYSEPAKVAGIIRRNTVRDSGYG